MIRKKQKPKPGKPSPVTGTSTFVIVSFALSLTFIIAAGIAMVAFVVYTHPANAELVIVAIGGTLGGLLGAVMTFAGLLIQVRSEVNHKLDQFIESKAALNFNAGMEAAEGGQSERKTGTKD